MVAVKDGHVIARWWEKTEDDRILCTLCPRACRIPEGSPGFCFVRQNIGGELVSLAYGQPAAVHVDPVEKKPLNHFLPGTEILSMGTAGCNLACKFCQNWDISKAKEDQYRSAALSPEEVVQTCLHYKIPSIACTYNDPIIWAEYVVDIAEAAKPHGVRTVMVTNGYITDEAFGDVFPHIDAANVDLKAFTEFFYRKLTGAHIEPIKKCLKRLRTETDVWFEITTLLIPDANDGNAEITEMCDWILGELGDDVPIHFTAFHPDYKLKDRGRTPSLTLSRARNLAMEKGLKFVYVGNVHDTEGQTTYCPKCGDVLVERDWHSVRRNRLKEGQCPGCGEGIPGRWV